jgi:hypothetical protein
MEQLLATLLHFAPRQGLPAWTGNICGALGLARNEITEHKWEKTDQCGEFCNFLLNGIKVKRFGTISASPKFWTFLFLF